MRSAIHELDISEHIKENMENAVQTNAGNGKLFTLQFEIYHDNQLADIFTLMDYKKRAK